MTPFEAVQRALAAWPEAVQADAAVRVPTHCLYPSNSVVSVFVEGGKNSYIVHDGGGAVDEMEASCARVPKAWRHLKHVVRPYGLDVNESGRIYSPHVGMAALNSAIVLVANASKEAAQYLLDRYRPPQRDLRRVLERILDNEFPNKWKRDLRIVGASNKLHRFDYVVSLPRDRKLLLDAVVPEASSINAAVVAHLDVNKAEPDAYEQRIVFDDERPWSSSDLALLRVGARPVPFSHAQEALERLAA